MSETKRTKALIKDMNQFIKDIDAGLIPTEKIIYVTNLLQNGLIDAFWAGKISQETLDKVLYPENEEPVDYNGQYYEPLD